MNPGLIVKLRPTSPWRVGPESGARNRVDAIYHSDSLYSAVTLAMSRLGELDAWLDATARSSAPSVCFSSCFPLVDDRLLVAPPRTVWPPNAASLASGRVRWKSARFVPVQIVRDILSGKQLDENRWTLDGPSGCLIPHGKLGPFRTSLRWSAAIDRLSGAAERHAAACVEFRAGAGLWTVASFADEAARNEWRDRVKGAFRWLADSGFGGERSRGWGRTEAPEFREGSVADLLGVGNVPKTMASTSIAQTPGGPDVIPPVQEPPQEEPPVTEPPSEPQLPEPDPDPDPLPPNAPEPVPGLESAETSSEAAQEATPETAGSAAQLAPPNIAPLAVPLEDVVSADADSSEGAVPMQDAAPAEESATLSEPFAPEGQSSEAVAIEPPSYEASSTEPASSESSPSDIALAEATPNNSAPSAPAEAKAEMQPAQSASSEPAPKSPVQNVAPQWLLSLFSPATADTVEWSRGNYSLIERGGRVESPAGSGALKKQVRMVAEGSVLYAGSALRGAAPDVAPDGFAHPVFRAGFALAIPLPEAR